MFNKNLGNYTFEAAANPMLTDLLYRVTESIPLNSTDSVYSNWLTVFPDEHKTSPM